MTEPSSFSRVPTQRILYGWRWAASGEAKAPKYRKISGTGPVDEITRRALSALR